MTTLRIASEPKGSYYDANPGEMWPCRHAASAHAVPGRAPCWVVRLPGGGYAWHTNVRSTTKDEQTGQVIDGEYWEVTGEPPNITVHPSINVGPEIWHGWITAGALSPDADVNGRAGGHRHPWRRVLLSSGKTELV